MQRSEKESKSQFQEKVEDAAFSNRTTSEAYLGVDKNTDQVRHDNGDRHNRRRDKQDALHQRIIQRIHCVRE